MKLDVIASTVYTEAARVDVEPREGGGYFVWERVSWSSHPTYRGVATTEHLALVLGSDWHPGPEDDGDDCAVCDEGDRWGGAWTLKVLHGRDTCPRCGRELRRSSLPNTCPVCQGEGREWSPYPDGDGEWVGCQCQEVRR